MPNILIVDDEESMRNCIKEVLASDGREFFLAADGAEALDLLRKKTMDLIIVDRIMPGMTGIEFVGLIRRNPKTASLKVLMCTGSSMTKEIEEAFSAGANDYVLKPLNLAQLTAKVAKALAAPPKPA